MMKNFNIVYHHGYAVVSIIYQTAVICCYSGIPYPLLLRFGYELECLIEQARSCVAVIVAVCEWITRTGCHYSTIKWLYITLFSSIMTWYGDMSSAILSLLLCRLNQLVLDSRVSNYKQELSALWCWMSVKRQLRFVVMCVQTRVNDAVGIAI